MNGHVRLVKTLPDSAQRVFSTSDGPWRKHKILRGAVIRQGSAQGFFRIEVATIHHG